ncbi:MAG: hypothetical protein J6R03_00235 [Treponema sp.]|nr:hypothetical protein [Treponema sp.]
MKKNKIIAILIVLVSFFAFSCSSSKNLAVDEVAEQENLSQNQLEEEVDEEKSDEKKSEKNKNYLGWEKTSNRPIDYTNGIVNIRIKPKLGSFCFYVINEDEKHIPVMSTTNEYVLSSFYLKAGKKIYKLNDDTNVQPYARTTENGCEILYTIPKVASVTVKFDCLASTEDGEADMIKVTANVQNIGQKKKDFSLKLIMDTVLGETDRHHFYVKNNSAIKNETSYRRFNDDTWFLSKNVNASMQIFFQGKDVTPIDFVAFANFSTLNTPAWEPNMQNYRTFDTILSYNNSAFSVNWIPKNLEPEKSFDEIFYMAFATGDASPKGALYMGPAKKNEVDFLKNAPTEEKKDEPKVIELIEVVPEVKEESEVQVIEEPEPIQEIKPATEEITPVQVEEIVEEVKEDNVVPQVKFDVTSLSTEQLTTEYIQNLLDRIANLEQSGTALNRTELLQLNAELDAILSVLRQ